MRTEFASELPRVDADSVQLTQVLINLLTNAFDAMEKLPSPQRHVVIRTLLDDRKFVRVEVRDSGPGLPAEVNGHIFDHFFTTKREGMGMGLAIARSIIESHGGVLKAENAEGAGAVFYSACQP